MKAHKEKGSQAKISKEKKRMYFNTHRDNIYMSTYEINNAK